jgi:hypothetical protein
MTDLGIDGLGCRCSGRVRKTRERKLDPAPHGVEGLYHEGPFLTLAEHLPRRTRRLVAHTRQRQIATRAVDGNECPVRGELLDSPFYLVSQMVPSDKGNKVQRLV